MPRKDDMQVSFRTNQDIYVWIHTQGGPKVYLENLIINDRLQRHDQNFLESEIKRHQEEIKILQDMKKQGPLNQDKIDECISYWKETYKNRTFLNDVHLENSIKKHVMPNLKKLGYQGTPHDVARIFLKTEEED